MAPRPKLRILTPGERLDLYAEMVAESGILSGLTITPVPMPSPLGRGRIRVTIEGEAGRIAEASDILSRLLAGAVS